MALPMRDPSGAVVSVRRLGKILPFLFFMVGLPGVVGDAAEWGAWLAWLPEGGWAWLVVGLSALLTVIANWGWVAKTLGLPRRVMSWREAVDATEVRQKLESDLRSLSNEHAHAKFGVWASEQVPVVLGLGSVFEAAGWKIKMNETPQGQHHLVGHSQEGIEVRGWNEHRVKAVVGFLSKCFHGVYAKIESSQFTPDNPKYSFVVNRVRLTVYREPPMPSGPHT